MDTGACLPLRNTSVPRPIFDPNATHQLPAPCYLIGSAELVYVYFGAGFIIPLLALTYVQFTLLLRFLTEKSWRFDLMCGKRNEGDGLGHEGGKKISKAGMERIKEMMDAKARQSMMAAFFTRAASPQSRLGQILKNSYMSSPLLIFWYLRDRPHHLTDVLESTNDVVCRSADTAKGKNGTIYGDITTSSTWSRKRCLARWRKPKLSFSSIEMGWAVICSGISLWIYLSSVSGTILSVEYCGTLPNIHQAADFLANIYMLFYFVVRLIGSDKRISVILHSMHSIVDYYTIPAVIISVVLNRYFTGFSFCRAYNCRWIVDILSNRGLFRKTNSVKLANLVFLVVSLLMIAAGFLHLVENMGDPWLLANQGSYNGQAISFWRCYLYLYGRVTLLDLSGMRVQTMFGRIIIYGFQILALGIVSKAIPEIILLVRIQPEWDKAYETPTMFMGTTVYGVFASKNFSRYSASFLREFYNKDRGTSELFKILILDEKKPDPDMKMLLEQYFNQLDYRRGTCMQLKDLNRAKLMEAEAVLILADRNAPDTDAEDAANIMRVVAVKNYRENIRVVVQIAQYHNKAYLQNIPSWNPKKGDIVICISELRLGLLAQNCRAPGFSTLMANFFTTRSFDHKKKYEDPWMADYVRGTTMELYSRPFSPAFLGMDFAKASEFCYRRLKIVLLAVHIKPTDPLSNPQINPPSHMVIREESYGFFIADSTKEVDRAQFYCAMCHEDADVLLIHKCDCQLLGSPDRLVFENQTRVLSRVLSHQADSDLENKIWSYICRYPHTPTHRSKESLVATFEEEQSVKSRTEVLFDSTGMFHWCSALPMAAVTKNRRQAAVEQFNNHIVVCVLSQPNSQIIGLASLVLPLRSSNIAIEDLHDVVLLGDVNFLEKEWPYLYNLPKIHVVKGTSLNRADLRSVNLDTCRTCIILGAPGSSDKGVADETMVDKNVILATLNVRAMRFSKDEDVHYGSLEEVHQMKEREGRSTGSINASRASGHDIPLITDLMRDSNVQFLEDDDTDLPGTEFYLSHPYAGGRAFASSVLDLLMISSFFDPSIIKVFHAMIFGGASLELERIIAEGAGLIGGEDISRPAEMRGQIIVVQFPLDSGPLRIHSDSVYGSLFLDALQSMGLVLLGLFRRINLEKGVELSSKRYVICNPPENFPLDATDLVFALERSDWRPASIIRAPIQPLCDNAV